jgi:hypothetical protein
VNDTWNSIPGKYFDDPTAVDGKRFVATPHGWQKIRNMLNDRAGFKCEECGAMAYFGDAHHVYGRGNGGGKRDDRIEVNGVRLLFWLCRGCHERTNIQPWGGWRG